MIKDDLTGEWKLIPCCYLVVEEVTCLDRVVERVIQLIGLKLVVFDQLVIRFLGKQQR